MEFQVRHATQQDAVSLAPRLRESDIEEIWAAAGIDPLPALLESLELSDYAFTATLDGVPHVMFGTNPITHEAGGIWMLGSKAIEENPVSFYKHCKRALREFHKSYQYLTNFVSCEHASANRWMLKLGFIPVQFIQDFGHDDRPFIQYISEA